MGWPQMFVQPSFERRRPCCCSGVPIGASTGERICGNGLEEEPTGYAAPKTHLIFGFRIVMDPLISNIFRGLTRPIDGARTVAIWWGVECETECHHRRVRQILHSAISEDEMVAGDECAHTATTCESVRLGRTPLNSRRSIFAGECRR